MVGLAAAVHLVEEGLADERRRQRLGTALDLLLHQLHLDTLDFGLDLRGQLLHMQISTNLVSVDVKICLMDI